jgi:uncharacterized protein YcbK (DUF882 family)
MHLPAFLRRPACIRSVSAFCVLAAVVAAAPQASARKFEAKKHPRMRAIAHAFVNAALPGMGLLPMDEQAKLEGQPYELKFARQGGEAIDVVYRVGDTYIPEALDRLNHFLKDSHNEIVTAYDPRTFDVLHTMLAKIGKSASVIDVLSAYRTKQTNDALRESGGTNAAEHSQHIEATAIDMRVPGVNAATLRDAALSLEAGGVGYYPKAQFVHVDVGPVRQWTYSPHRGAAGRHGHGRHRKHA